MDTICDLGPNPRGVRVREQAWRKSAFKERHVLSLPGLGSARFVWPDRSVETARTALYERVLRENRGGAWVPVQRPDARVFSAMMQPAKAALLPELGLVPCMRLEHVPDLYVGRQRQVYLQAVSSLSRKAISKEDAEVKGFVKVEKLPWKEVGGVMRFVPRLIHPRDPRYACSLMRFIHPIEKLVYRAWARVFRERVVFKGVNADEAGQLLYAKWSRFLRPVAVGLDASRFDQHVSKSALKWEHDIYLAAISGDRSELSRLLSWQLENHCKLRAEQEVISYTVEGMRCSGDPNTGLGNCTLMCGMVYAYMTHLGYVPEDYALVNNGDDCVVIMEERMLNTFIGQPGQGLVEFFDLLGFVMKVEAPVRLLEQIEFCQMHPVEVAPGSWRLVRNYTCISKDVSTVKYLPNAIAVKNYFYTVAQGGLSIASGVPVYQAFYLWMARSMAGGRLIDDPVLRGGLWWWSKGMQASVREPTGVARLSFARAFGVTVEQQMLREAYFAALPPVDCDHVVDAEETYSAVDMPADGMFPLLPEAL